MTREYKKKLKFKKKEQKYKISNFYF